MNAGAGNRAPDPGGDVYALIERADPAMYAAKKDGGGSYCFSVGTVA